MKSKKAALIVVSVIAAVSIIANIILSVMYVSLHNDFTDYSNSTMVERVERDTYNKLYEESLKMIGEIYNIYDDIEELSKYDFEMIGEELASDQLSKTGEFQSCRDELFQIFNDIYIFKNNKSTPDCVSFYYFYKEDFLTYSDVILDWFPGAPPEDIYTVNEAENGMIIEIERTKYVKIHDNLYIEYRYYMHF